MLAYCMNEVGCAGWPCIHDPLDSVSAAAAPPAASPALISTYQGVDICFGRHSGHCPNCCLLDPVANDPTETLAGSKSRSALYLPVCVGIGLPWRNGSRYDALVWMKECFKSWSPFAETLSKKEIQRPIQRLLGAV